MTDLRKAARGQDCTIRLVGCNHNPETTILAHLSGIRFKHGIGKKVNDLHGAWCCSSCHDLIDSRVRTTHYSREELKLAHLEGVIETQIKLIEKGIL
jgi:hypothetical protein